MCPFCYPFLAEISDERCFLFVCSFCSFWVQLFDIFFFVLKIIWGGIKLFERREMSVSLEDYLREFIICKM